MLKTKSSDTAVKEQFVTFSIRIPADLSRRCREIGRKRLWSRNRVIEQALVAGLPQLQGESAR